MRKRVYPLGQMATKRKGKKAKTVSPAPRAKSGAATKDKSKKTTAAARPKKAAARKAKGRTTKPVARKRAASTKPATRKPTATAKVAARNPSTSSKSATRSRPRAKPVGGKTQAIRRRDGAGHLDPKYAAELRARIGRPEREPQSFVAGSRSRDDLVEELGEEVIETATSGEYEGQDALNREVPEETGGPFVNTTGAQEFAHGTDASNPKGAKREPFPTT